MTKKSNLNSMLCLDIYMANCSAIEYQKAKQSLLRTTKRFPLISWGLIDGLKLKNTNKNDVDLLKLYEFEKQFNWKVDFKNILNQDYEALIITDVTQTIFWVNDGFSKMTGYSKEFALGKTPKFLQGQNTSSETKKTIKTSIKASKVFKGVIVNYQKNNEEYLCEVTVIPIKNKYNINTHFIALERKIA